MAECKDMLQRIPSGLLFSRESPSNALDVDLVIGLGLGQACDTFKASLLLSQCK